jgi:hypothetical protein
MILDVPLPTPRPSGAPAPIAEERPLLVVPQQSSRTKTASPETTPASSPSIFERFFGSQRSSGPALAYATANDASAPARGGWLSSMFSGSTTVPARGTAIYDISARTVYLPNGEKLEAHSGMGDTMDDPRHVDVKMRGATPPHVYDLTEREQPFHGVQALRLNPVGGSDAIHGRAGLLAHTYMLGPRGDSNGCISFRDYGRFLAAYRRGDVKRLIVVANAS